MTPGEYDPDKMSIYDIDPDDEEMLWAWFNHPNTEAMTNDLGREFRALPAADQIAELREERQRAAERRDEFAEAVGSDLPPDDPRRLVILELERLVWLIEVRISELEGEAP